MSALIHLCYLNLPADQQPLPEHWPCLLNAADSERYQSIVRPARRIQFLIGRLLLADAASRAAGFAIPATAIALQDSGRPYLPDHPALALGLSHSKQRIIAACGPVPVIGLDTERRDERRPLLQLAEHSFGKALADRWAKLPADMLLDVFYQRWCDYEARYKAGIDQHAPSSHSLSWRDGDYQHCLLSTESFEVVWQPHSLDSLLEIYCRRVDSTPKPDR